MTIGFENKKEESIIKTTPGLPNQVTTRLSTLHTARFIGVCDFFELMIKGRPKHFMLSIKSKAILKCKVNNFSYIFFFLFHPALINVIHCLIYHILGKEKSSSLLLLKVALMGQYPVITNPTNHNRLLLKDI